MPTRSELLTSHYYAPLLSNALRIGLILLLAYLASIMVERLMRALRKYAAHGMTRAGGASVFEIEKRVETITGVARRTLVILIWVAAIIMALDRMGLNVGPLLAGAGILGVAIGFGAQNVVKDILAGMFLLLENQIRINDVAVINGTTGMVEEINLRTTILRAENGAVHIFPNGNINSLSNLTREYAYYVFEFSLAYRQDTDQVFAILRDIATDLQIEPEFRDAILAPLEVIGVDRLTDSSVVIKARIKTLAMKQWIVGREMNRRIQQRFETAGIQTASATMAVKLAPDPPTSASR